MHTLSPALGVKIVKKLFVSSFKKENYSLRCEIFVALNFRFYKIESESDVLESGVKCV